ncbi:HEAT repeat domain-containing protein [Belliella kenyensis]|uniref:HEAT repeat domain-containing protein n=1 Tax=Belliella kenyensis TaxID=1472724 RepID=A0ABV8EJ91_9BACT|nr:HEAT repeat domain-containing protein [Belliella kenyensis]MCH7400243.1 HEAT repeat domain-containing protein [Belliella kenyensis]MDN3604740.1 HEAT repeat domain-containing protein [Belliella kenyensis]
MDNKIQSLFIKMCDKSEDEAYAYADQLAEIGTEEILDKLIEILNGEDIDNSYLAARALSKMEHNQKAIEPLLELIHHHKNKHRNGQYVQALEGFDLSERFVDLLRIYLFSNFKSSTLAKYYLDYVEFDLSPRTLKKAEKHWGHYENNVDKESDDYLIKKEEVLTMFEEIKALFE